MQPSGDVAVVIPAKNESDRIGATVTAAAQLAGVDIVVVVDDGSTDATATAAAAAGARVVRHSRCRGKAAAMETGAEAVALIEGVAGTAPSAEEAAGSARPVEDRHGADADSARTVAGSARTVPHHLLFLDADLASTAAQAGPLAAPVRDGVADMTIAVFSKRVRKGGHGFVVGLSGAGIERATGWRPAEPLNGQRCLTRAAFEAALPLAHGWGAETGMTIDLLRRGMRVTEVEVPLAHRATGQDWRAQLHRAGQFADVARALAAGRWPRGRWRRGIRSGGPRGTRGTRSDPADVHHR
jgi:Glycosyl transferase family 2